MLRDVLATWEDWPDELQTVTGFDWRAYQMLSKRLMAGADYAPEHNDEAMLVAAANQFRGYPGIVTFNLESAFGEAWSTRLNEAFFPAE